MRILALLVLVFVLHLGRADLPWTQSDGASTLDVVETSWFFTVPSPSSLFWDGATVCSTAPSALLDARCSTADPTLAVCCADCTDHMPTVNSPQNQPGCVCSPVSQGACTSWDEKDFLVMNGTSNPTSAIQFAIPVLNPVCRPLKFVLNTLSGDADLQLSSASPAYASLSSSSRQGKPIQPYRDFVQAEIGDDVFFICTPSSAGVDQAAYVDPDTLGVLNSSSPVSWVYLRINAKSLSTFRLSLSVVNSAADLLVPIRELSNRASVQLTCESNSSVTLVNCSYQLSGGDSNACGLVVSNSYPDPAAQFYSLAAAIDSEDSVNVSTGLLVILPLKTTTDRNAVINLFPNASLISNCRIQVSDLIDSSGSRLSLNESYVQLASPISAAECRSAALNNFLYRWSQKLDSLQDDIPLLGNDLSSIGWLYGALLSSSDWVACNKLAESLLEITELPEDVSFNSTRCYADVESPDYLQDPCCNPLLDYTQCCQPRLQTQRKIQFSASAEATRCQSARCSMVVAERLLQSQKDRKQSLLTCREQIAVNIQDPQIYRDIVTSCRRVLSSYDRSEIKCQSDSDCYTKCSSQICNAPSNNTGYLSALKACLIQSMSPPLRAVFLAGRDADSALAEFFSVGCDQGGRIDPDSTLDSPEKCAAAESCNSDPNLARDQCLLLASQLPYMCARCDGPICNEVSVFPGCASFPPVSSAAACNEIEGAIWRNNNCFLSGISTQNNCLQTYQSSGTGQTCAAMYTGARSCPSLCVPTAFIWISDESYCNCENPPSQISFLLPLRAAYKHCDSMVWNMRTDAPGLCMFAYEPQDCIQAISGNPSSIVLTRGSTWSPTGVFSSQSLCLGTGDPSPFACSLPCANCSDPFCGICSDNNFNGYCFFNYVPTKTPSGVKLGCPQLGGIEYPDGCMYQGLDITNCLLNGGEWRPASITQKDCESNTACFEPTKFRTAESTFVSFTPKNQASCSSCGAKLVSPQTWQSGQLLDRSKFQWLNRSWSAGNFIWRETFNVSEFNRALSAARSTYLYLGTRALISCLTGQDQFAVAQIACDCDASRDAQCYGKSLSFTAVSTEVCGLYAVNLTVPGKLSVEIDQDTQFTSGCIALKVDVVDSVSFARSSASVISSAFVQSLQLKRLSVVVNSHDVVIGQLSSDAYAFVLGDGGSDSVINGEIRLCVPLQTGNRQSGWKKIGVAWARFTGQDDFASVTLHRLDTAAVARSSGDFYCFPVYASGIYALARYHPDAGSALFFDTLTPDQQAALIIVIIVYFFLWLLISIALGNFALWWTIQRTAVKFSVDQLKASLNFGLLWLASAIRWIYFLVVTVGAANDMPKPVEIFMVELPLFFFFSVLTVIILKWLEVARKSGGKNKKPPVLSLSNVLAVILNWIMYSLLVIFVILASVGITTEDPGKCSTSTSKENPALSITYHVIVAAICFGLGASFILIGTKVTIQLLRLGGATSQKVRFLQFTSVAGACSIAMILQAILLVVTTAVVVPSIVAIIILIIVEVVPIVLLIWTWNKPIAIGKVVSSIASIGSSSRSNTTSSGSSSSASGGSSSTDGSSSGSASGASDTPSTSSGGGLARLWSLGTDSLDGLSVAEEE